MWFGSPLDSYSTLTQTWMVLTITNLIQLIQYNGLPSCSHTLQCLMSEYLAYYSCEIETNTQKQFHPTLKTTETENAFSSLLLVWLTLPECSSFNLRTRIALRSVSCKSSTSATTFWLLLDFCRSSTLTGLFLQAGYF